MELLRTEKDIFDTDDILKALKSYEEERVPKFDTWWKYYKAKNTAITSRPAPDANNPDHRTKVSYGRKLVMTWKGYAYRPGYITYKSEKEQFLEALLHTFKLNNEVVKTSRTGRNTGIFGVAYELFYIDLPEGSTDMAPKAEPMFINVDPRNMLLFHDYSPEPKKMISIYVYPINKDWHKVEVSTPTVITKYDRIRKPGAYGGVTEQWTLTEISSRPNQFGEVPVVAYYLGDEQMGIIEPVIDLIDNYDMLVSDSVVEFDRFANAYLLLKGFSLTDAQKQESQSFSMALRSLKRKRVFEKLKETDDVKFLLKDTPKDFIAWLAELIRDEIHKQSHVPDFMSEKLGGNISGVAVARMMFDFENLVSSAEGDFNIGLDARLRLITNVYQKGNRNLDGDAADVTISHKRNVPQNVKEFAETAVLMKNAGFSSYLVADIMPDDVIPDVEAELARQKEERTQAFADVEMFQRPPVDEEEEDADQV